MGCFYHYCPCQEARPALTEEDIQPATKKRELDQMRRRYIEKKRYTAVEMWECWWWNLYKTKVSVKEHLRESSPFQRPLRQAHIMDKIKSGALFDYVQCDINVPDQPRENIVNFPPVFKNTKVCRQRIHALMQKYAEKKRLMSQPWRLLYFSFELNNGTSFNPLLLFYLELELVSTNIYRFVEFPCEMFHQFCAIRYHCSLSRRRESHLQCCCRNIEVACKELVGPSNYGSQ